MKKIKIEIMSVFPKYSALWNYGFFMHKYLSKNKNFEVRFSDLWNKEYQNNIKRAVALITGIKPASNADVLILVAPLLSKTLVKSDARLKIVIVHDLYPLTIKKVPLTIKILAKQTYRFMRNADILLPVSDFCKKEILKTYGFKKNIIKLNGAIDHTIFNKLRNKNALKKKHGILNKTVFLHIGRNDPRKNFRFVLELFERLKIDDKLLIKIGDMSESEKRFVKAHNLQHSVRTINGVDSNILNEIYNASDILLFPSLYEGFGLPPVEAMACGLPVIASDKPALNEVCIKESLTPLELRKWENKVTKILNDKKFRENLIKKGLLQAKKFDWRIYAEKLSKIMLNKLDSDP